MKDITSDETRDAICLFDFIFYRPIMSGTPGSGEISTRGRLDSHAQLNFLCDMCQFLFGWMKLQCWKFVPSFYNIPDNNPGQFHGINSSTKNVHIKFVICNLTKGVLTFYCSIIGNMLKITCPPRWRRGSRLDFGSEDPGSIPRLPSPRVGPLVARR